MPDAITLTIDGRRIQVPAGCSVAAAIARAAKGAGPVTRVSVAGAARGPLCGMGICQECRVSIDGHAHRLACQTLCAPGMRVVTGAPA